MIGYFNGVWGVGFIWSLKGSVFWKSLVWGLPCAGLSVGLHYGLRLQGDYRDEEAPFGEGVLQGVAGCTLVFGILLVSRAQNAYARYLEGAKLFRLVRGQWVGATSSLIAFCNMDPGKIDEVEVFQHHLVRLMSMLFTSAVHHVAISDCDQFQIIDDDGLDPCSLQFVSEASNQCEVIMQWIQKLVVLNLHSGVINVAGSILASVFSDLGKGMVDLQTARVISDVPYPFPFAQLITIILILYSTLLPVVFAMVLHDAATAGVCAFIFIIVLWGLNYAAIEIEMPFGDDPNDIALAEWQAEFNATLVSIMDLRSQSPPHFSYCHSHKDLRLKAWLRSNDLNVKKYATKKPRSSGRAGAASKERLATATVINVDRHCHSNCRQTEKQVGVEPKETKADMSLASARVAASVAPVVAQTLASTCAAPQSQVPSRSPQWQSEIKEDFPEEFLPLPECHRGRTRFDTELTSISLMTAASLPDEFLASPALGHRRVSRVLSRGSGKSNSDQHKELTFVPERSGPRSEADCMSSYSLPRALDDMSSIDGRERITELAGAIGSLEKALSRISEGVDSLVSIGTQAAHTSSISLSQSLTSQVGEVAISSKATTSSVVDGVISQWRDTCRESDELEGSLLPRALGKALSSGTCEKSAFPWCRKHE